MHAFGYLLDGQSTEERPFYYAVNKSRIKCYVRKAGLRRIGMAGRYKVKAVFPESDILKNELRIDLTSADQADRLLKCLFPSENG